MLTPEQVNKLEEIRAKWESRFDGHIRRDESIPKTEQDFLDLFAIVDDLRKQLNAAVLLGEAAASLQPEKLNGGEIMAECFRAYEVKHEYESFAAGWLAAFRMMGAIKE